MKKKLLSAILATAMMATVLTGCGGSNEQPAAAPAAEEPAAEAPAADGACGRGTRGRGAGSRSI